MIETLAEGEIPPEKPNKKKGFKEFVETPNEQMKLALWFVGKFHDPEEAMESCRLAVESLTNLNKRRKPRT